MKKRSGKITASLSILLFAVALIPRQVVFRLGASIPLVLQAVALIVGGLSATLFLFISNGFKRAPFFFAVLCAWAGIILAFIDIPLSSHIAGVSTGFTVFSAISFCAAWIAQKRIRLNPLRFTSLYLLVAVLCAVSALVTLSGLYGGTDELTGKEERSHYDTLIKEFSPYLERYEAELLPLLKDLAERNIPASQRSDEIERLTRRIQEMEEERELWQESRERISRKNRDLQDELDRLSSSGPCGVQARDAEPVSSFAEGVRPFMPCVREYGLTLASDYPGSFYRAGQSRGVPGDTGYMQIMNIHNYVSGSWKYINDPLWSERDYFAPANRSIAVGLSGDCDDYAILMASLIEAIGGRTRILAGSCAAGGHAWAEVFIGNSNDWMRMQNRLSGKISGFNAEQYPVSGGGFWLSLDWELGRRSCGGSPVLLYQSS